MRCPLEPQDAAYLRWKKDVDELLKQHDHAHGNGNLPNEARYKIMKQEKYNKTKRSCNN